MNTDAKNPQQNISKVNSTMHLKDHIFKESNGNYPGCKNGSALGNLSMSCITLIHSEKTTKKIFIDT